MDKKTDRMKALRGFLAMGLLIAVNLQAADANLLFYSSFDDGVAADVSVNGKTKPLATPVGTEFVQGVKGNAILINGTNKKVKKLEYSAEKLFNAEEGTVSFWVQPNWDSAAVDGKLENHFFFTSPNNLRIWLWNWLRADLFGEKDGKPVCNMLSSKSRSIFTKGGWHHLAVTWGKDGWDRLYVDGRPNLESLSSSKSPMKYDFRPKGSETIEINQNTSMDELKIYSKALNDDEIMAEYREVAPLEFLISRSFLKAGVPETLIIDLIPEKGNKQRIGGLFTVNISNTETGEIISQNKKAVAVTTLQQVKFSIPPLAVGKYFAECSFRHGKINYKRTFRLTVYKPEPKVTPSLDDIKLGEKILTIDCLKTGDGCIPGDSVVKNTPLGSYREASPEKFNGFAYEVKIPNPTDDPYILEITYPDDKARAMGLYMFIKSERAQLRDYLGGGEHCGAEYPNSNKMRKVRYVFWPGSDEYLFEVRTLVAGWPAAVQKMEVFRVAGGFPSLKINTPKEGVPRSVGLLDEDQIFQLFMDWKKDSVRLWTRLLNYMNYTGQDVISYSLTRYVAAQYHGPNKVGYFQPGWVELLLDMMEDRGIQLVANVNLMALPSQKLKTGIDDSLMPEGLYLINKSGEKLGNWGGVNRLNPVSPDAKAEYLDVLGDILRRFGKHKAFRGLQIWHYPIAYKDLDNGYGDYTIALFEKETGIKVPGTSEADDRFGKRYDFLTGEKRTEWLKWRATKTTALFKEISQMVRKTKPSLKLYSTFSQASEEDLYEKHAIDLQALKKIPNMMLCLVRRTEYRWDLFSGKETEAYEKNLNIAEQKLFRNGTGTGTFIYMKYYESFKNSMMPKKYNSYFQSPDLNPNGRFFLQNYATAIRGQDPMVIMAGGQTIGVSGRAPEVREFARAFRALPVSVYGDIKGLNDPVCGRYTNMKTSTYFYLNNQLWTDTSAEISIHDGINEVVDLSTLEKLPVINGKITLQLKPYQLRSFSISSPNIKLTTGKAIVFETTVEWYKEQLASIKKDLATMVKFGADISAYQQQLDKINKELANGKYAEAHRQLNVKLLCDLPAQLEIAKKGYLKEMATYIARSEYHVNSGAKKFHRVKDGTLFFPDQPYKDGTWGYLGENRTRIDRGGGEILGTEDDELFREESYWIEGYKFKVKPGKYTVKLYLAVRYERGCKPGNFVMDVDVEGKNYLKNFDIVNEAGGKPHTAVIREIKNIEVTDGCLDVEYGHPASVHPSVQLSYAIEVIPEE